MTLKEFRLSKQKTVKEMADIIGISKSMYEKLESHDRTPGFNTLKKIKEKFPDFDVNIFLNSNHTNWVTFNKITQREVSYEAVLYIQRHYEAA